MKKLSLILAGALLMGGISFAAPVAKQQPASTSTSKQATKPAAKKEVKKSNTVKKGAPVKKDASAPAK